MVVDSWSPLPRQSWSRFPIGETEGGLGGISSAGTCVLQDLPISLRKAKSKGSVKG